jgi:hypothetical protein
MGDLDWQMYSHGMLSTPRISFDNADHLPGAFLDHNNCCRHCHRCDPNHSLRPHGLDVAA